MKSMDRIKAEIQNRNIEEALKLMEQIPENEKNGELYLLKGICLQLANLTSIPQKDVETSLRMAIELDPNYKDAKLELAYFLLNVKNDPSEAKKYFLQVLKATRDEVPSGISSLMESSEELRNTNSMFVTNLKLQAETYLAHAEKKKTG